MSDFVIPCHVQLRVSRSQNLTGAEQARMEAVCGSAVRPGRGVLGTGGTGHGEVMRSDTRSSSKELALLPSRKKKKNSGTLLPAFSALTAEGLTAFVFSLSAGIGHPVFQQNSQTVACKNFEPQLHLGNRTPLASLRSAFALSTS